MLRRGLVALGYRSAIAPVSIAVGNRFLLIVFGLAPLRCWKLQDRGRSFFRCPGTPPAVDSAPKLRNASERLPGGRKSPDRGRPRKPGQCESPGQTRYRVAPGSQGL